MYLYVLFRVTLLRNVIGYAQPTDYSWVPLSEWLTNLIPLKSTIRSAINLSDSFIGIRTFIGLNLLKIITYVPFGFMLPYLLPKSREWKSFMITACVTSFLILFIGHLTSYLLFNVDRFLLSVLGSTAGWWMFRKLYRREVKQFLGVWLVKTGVGIGVVGAIIVCVYYSWNTYADNQMQQFTNRLSDYVERGQIQNEISEPIKRWAVDFVNNHRAIRKIITMEIGTSHSSSNVQFVYPNAQALNANGLIPRVDEAFRYSSDWGFKARIGGTGQSLLVQSSVWYLAPRVFEMGVVLLIISAILIAIAGLFHLRKHKLQWLRA